MTEVDTASYRQPIPKSPLEVLGQAQQLKQQSLGIEKSQLDLINQGYGYLLRELNSLGPNATPDQLVTVGQNAVKQKLIKPEMYGEFVKTIPTDPAQMPSFVQSLTSKLMSTQEATNFHYGVPTSVDNGQTQTPSVVSPKFGVRPTNLPIQNQVPPTAIARDAEGAPQFLGPQPPQIAPGSGAVPGPVPLQPNRVRTLPVGPINDPRIKGPSQNFGGNVLGASVEQPGSFDNRFDAAYPKPRGPSAGLPPGVGEAEVIAAGGSGKQLAEDRDASSNYQRSIFPITEAIGALQELGTKGTGPGTESINKIKSFVLSNVPGVSEKDFEGLDKVKVFDKAAKYLTDIVNQTGSSGTNDKLAAAFAGNPSVKISNAAATDVAKSLLALRRMKQAQLIEFDKLDKPASQYSKWASTWNNDVDPRAFGVDQMTPEAKQKLFGQLKKNPKEYARFERTLEIAHNAGLLSQ